VAECWKVLLMGLVFAERLQTEEVEEDIPTVERSVLLLASPVTKLPITWLHMEGASEGGSDGVSERNEVRPASSKEDTAAGRQIREHPTQNQTNEKNWGEQGSSESEELIYRRNRQKPRCPIKHYITKRQILFG
jgi:hypothetical protein